MTGHGPLALPPGQSLAVFYDPMRAEMGRPAWIGISSAVLTMLQQPDAGTWTWTVSQSRDGAARIIIAETRSQVLRELLEQLPPDPHDPETTHGR